ncbi:cytochrome D1 [Candidatus Jettenia sp. AMX1]|nr:cytochrome D1 [Candidatus Jettenia sp. AMX1]
MVKFLFARIRYMRYISKKFALFCSAVICLFLLSCDTSFQGSVAKEGLSISEKEPGTTDVASASGNPNSAPAQQGGTGTSKALTSGEADEEAKKIVREGIAVEFSIIPVVSGEKISEELKEGDDVTVQFRITDTTTGAPVTTLDPAAWIQLSTTDDCAEKVQSLLSGSLSSRAEIDLNIFYVLTLNDEASISVVDPLFNYGGSNLLARVPLKSPGEDWVMSQDQRRLFVTMPQANQIAVIDTAAWKVVANVDTGQRPMRIALQPDEKYLWVGADGAADTLDTTSGVTVIDTVSLKKVAHIPTGAGHHEIAFTGDDRYAFVTNRDAGTVSIVDIWKLNKIRDIQSGRMPVSIAYSALSKAAYVVNEEDGTILVVDSKSLEIVNRIEAKPGLGVLRFTRNGRLGFAVNSRENSVHIIDASTHRIIQTGDVGKEPDQVIFTENTAYIRSRGSESILMIPLDQVGHEGAPVPVNDFIGGQVPFGKAQSLSIADSIVSAPGGGAVLVANPVDKAIYYYQEGMAAPMGNFRNYGCQPRAILVIDRSLKEVEAGVYATNTRLTLNGKLDIILFMDSPRIIHCFSVNVRDNPDISKKDKHLPLRVEPMLEKKTLYVGENVQLLFKVIDPGTDQPRVGLKDFGVMAFTSGNWQNRQWARPVGDGIYQIDLTPPKAGAYYISFQCPSLNVRLNQLPPLILQVASKG